MAEDPDIKFDHSLLGVAHSLGSFSVTREMIVAFAIATGETDPAFTGEGAATESGHDDIVAPPTFCNAFLNIASRPDIRLEFGDTGFFAGQAIECLAPVRPGDTLLATTKLQDVYAKTGRSGKMVFVAWETTFTNQRSETVALVRDTHVRRYKRT